MQENIARCSNVSTCSICFDPFESEGDHMLSSLSCGHLFGERCIRRWIKRSKFCPQCHVVAKPKDIRVLYVPEVVVRESAAERRLARLLEVANAEKNAALRHSAALSLEYDNLKSALDDAVNALKTLEAEKEARKRAEDETKILKKRLEVL